MNQFVAEFLGAANSRSAVCREANADSVLLEMPGVGFVHAARPSQAPPVDQQVTLFVRPERISIVPFTAEKPLQSPPAIVFGRTFLGRHFEFNLRLEDGTTWTENAVDQAAFFSFDVGAQVLLHIEPANVIVSRCRPWKRVRERMNPMKTAKFHVHFNSRREAHPVFHMTDKLCKSALARRSDLAGKVRITTDWDLAKAPEALKTAAMLVTSMQVPRENLRALAPALRSIHFIGAGVEYLRPFDWVPKGIEITNNRGIHHQKAAEYILMCVLMLNNRVPTLMNAQSRREWQPMFSDHLKGKTLLIVGVGHLGGAGARQAKRCGLFVIGVRRSGRRHRYCDEVVGQERMHEVLPRADFIVVTVPSTSATDGMIGAREFALMKKTAGFVNFSRAQVVDYRALDKRLRTGALGGAVLDVFDPEPLPPESYLWTTPNLLITPHCSSDDLDRYIPMTLDLIFENVARSIAGRKLLNRVDVQRQY